MSRVFIVVSHRYDECKEFCDRGLAIDAKDEKFVSFRAVATKAQKEAERNARKEAALEKKKQTEEARLIEAIKSRGITIHRCRDL